MKIHSFLHSNTRFVKQMPFQQSIGEIQYTVQRYCLFNLCLEYSTVLIKPNTIVSWTHHSFSKTIRSTNALARCLGTNSLYRLQTRTKKGLRKIQSFHDPDSLNTVIIMFYRISPKPLKFEIWYTQLPLKPQVLTKKGF